MEAENGGGRDETLDILKEVAGGLELIAWFDGEPTFCDAEVLELRLLRKGKSVLRLAAVASQNGPRRGPPFKHAVLDFTLSDMIDVRLEGFGDQNIIGGLVLRRVAEDAVDPSLYGLGPIRGEVEIELAPRAGAFGTIRCAIEKVELTSVHDFEAAEAMSAQAGRP